jgi:hypothetical protein
LTIYYAIVNRSDGHDRRLIIGGLFSLLGNVLEDLAERPKEKKLGILWTFLDVIFIF